MGAFDDLIPQHASAGAVGAPTGGAFDDLIPAPKPSAGGAFDDLIPAAQTPAADPPPGALAPIVPDPLPSPALPLFAGQERAQAVDVQPPLARLLDPRPRTVGGPTQVSGERTAPAVLQDVTNPRAPLSGPELQGVLDSLANGLTLDPVQRAALDLRLSPQGQQTLRETEQALAARDAMAGHEPLTPGGPALREFLAGAGRGATLNAPVPGATLPPTLQRAQDLLREQQAAEHPVAGMAGEMVGSLVPYVAGGVGLRAAQEAAAVGASRGAPGLARLLGRPAAVGDTAALVREGATLGGPIELLRRPQGAEQMTAGEELAARATQSALGVTLGAAGDALLGGVLAPLFRQGRVKAGDLVAARRDARTAAALEKEAAKAGFASADEYLKAAVELRTGPEGALIVVPRQDVLSTLPGGEAPPPPAGGASAAPPDAGAPAPPAPDRPTPESAATLAAQLDAFAAGRKPGILLTPGEAPPQVLPQGALVADIPGRGMLIYRDPATLEAARAGRVGEALGYGIDEKPPGSETVLTARDAQGRVVNDVVTDGSPAVAEAAQVAAGPQGTVQERTAQAALQERELTRRAERYDALAAQETDPQVRAELQQLAQLARNKAVGSKVKLTPAELSRQRRQPDFEADDLVTLIQKLGGLNVDSGDWRGYLNPVKNPLWGLPNPEQSGGKGMRLDMLSERLWEYGWIRENDLSLVEELLDRARTGEKVYSPTSSVAAEERARIETENEADRARAGQGPDSWSTDEDWAFDVPGVAADRSAAGFVIRPQDGDVVPARLIDEADLERIIAEERIAAEEAALNRRLEDEKWQREIDAERAAEAADQERAAGADAAGVSGRPSDAGALGVPQRDGGGPEGRPGDQPGQGDLAGGADRPRAAATGQLDLAGVPARSESAQSLADRRRAVAEGLTGGGRDVPIDAGPGGLFSARARNLDLLDAPGSGTGAFDDLIPTRPREPVAPAAPADALTPQQRASYERLREAADFEPETLTPEQWSILDRLEQRLAGGEADAGRLRRAATADEQAQLARDVGEGQADEPGVASRPGRPTGASGTAWPLEQPRGPVVRHEAVDSLPTASRTVRTAEDVAHLVASLRRDAQETVLAVVTDADGNVLRVSRIARGGVDQAAVDPRVAAGAVASTPGGRQAWFVHNHPLGGPGQSAADGQITSHLAELLRGSGVEVKGMVTVAPGRRAEVQTPAGLRRELAIRPGVRREAVDVTERRLRGQPGEKPVSELDLPEVLPHEEGVMLLSGDGRPSRWVPMSADDMRLLRQGEGGPSQRLLTAMDETNAQRMAARVTTPDKADAAAGNLRAFGRQLGASVDGVFDAGGRAVGEAADQATFYSNPFLAGLPDLARQVGLHPVRSALAGTAGAVGGGTLSEAEPGSARWWLDVATGATVGVGGFAALRRLGVVGEGSFADRVRVRAGTWLNDWLFGNLGVREIKDQADLMRMVLDRQTGEVGTLLRERFTPSQRAQMADLIETRGIVADFNAVHAQAQALDDYLTAVGERLKALGLLPPDVETGGYLHRYYAKHLGLDSAFREAKAQSLSGSYSMARGTESAFGQDYLSPGARAVADELAQVQRDIERLTPRLGDLLEGDTAARLGELKARRGELRKTEFVEFVGEQNGKPHSFFFVRDEVPRVPGEDGRAVLAQLARPGAQEIARRPVLPTVPVGDLSPTGRVWSPTGARKPGQGASEVLLHRDWTKAEREHWGEITDAGYRFVRGMAEVSHDVAVGTVFETVARRAEWARPTDPGLWTNPPAGKRRFKGQPWVLVPATKVGKRSGLNRYGKLAGMYVRPDVWQALKRYGQPVFEMPPGKATVPVGAALGAAYGATAGPAGALLGAVAGAGIGALGSRELYRHWLARWKMWKTVYNPVTHLNNTVSNVEMLLMSGYSPAALGGGVKHLVQGEQSALWREARDAGLFGTDWASTLLGSEGGAQRTLLDLAEELRTQPEIPDAVLVTDRLMRLKDWWVNSRQAVADAQGPAQTGAQLARIAGQPAIKGLKAGLAPVKKLARAAERLYQVEDNVFKMAVFAAAREQGKTARQAVAEANTFFFNYRDVPDAVRFARDLPIGSPFVTYTYKVIPAIARNLVRNPENVLALVAGYEALNYAGYLTDGGQPGEYWAAADADEELSPAWEKGRSMWGARNMVRLPFMDGYRMALGRSHAAGNPFASEAGNRTVLATPDVLTGAWGPALYGSNPLAAVMDLLTNQDWRGKPIFDKGAPDAAKMRAAAEYLYQAWTPSNILTPGGYHQGKVLEGMANDVRRAQEVGRAPPIIAPMVDLANGLAADLGLEGFTGLDRMGQDVSSRDALLSSFGVKLRPVRHEDSVDIRLAQSKRKLADAKAWITARGRLLGEGRISDAQYDKELAQYDGEVDMLLREQDTLLEALERLQGTGVSVQVERKAAGE